MSRSPRQTVDSRPSEAVGFTGSRYEQVRRIWRQKPPHIVAIISCAEVVVAGLSIPSLAGELVRLKLAWLAFPALRTAHSAAI